MKFKILSRSETEHTRSRRDDPFVVNREHSDEAHPFQRQREYVRALKAAKLERHFAKPFVAALEGHVDAVQCLATSSKSQIALVSGSCDGEVRVWDVPSKRPLWKVEAAHTGFVRGVSVCAQGDSFLSCGDDKTVKLWSLMKDDEDHSSEEAGTQSPLNTFTSDDLLQGVDAHWRKYETFATCGETVCIWDINRPDPVHTFSWGADAILSVKFNPAETNLLASVGKSDRSVVLYDIRQKTNLKKMIQPTRNNQLAWNPMEPYCFTTANEDSCLYTFDMRRIDRALIVHKDHVSAVLDVAYSPTGKEFVSGSYDKSVRIFSVRPGWESKGRSREIYTAPRMQRVFSVRFSTDARFVFSGSDDGNIRLWKAEASRPLGTLAPNQRRALEYNQGLLEKFKHMKEVRQIHNKRILPKSIFKESKKQLEMNASQTRKRTRAREHGQGGEIKSLKRTAVLKTED